MATLSQTTTSGESSFDKYVKNNPRFLETVYEIEKGVEGDLFVKKGSKFAVVKTLKSGTKLHIIENKTTNIAQHKMC